MPACSRPRGPARARMTLADKGRFQIRVIVDKVVDRYKRRRGQLKLYIHAGGAVGEICIFCTEPESKSEIESEPKAELGLESKEITTAGLWLRA
ncbi:hypothetical protein EVAR_32954_1 [Eumeta japonica]|uniref:Uncharacterized protein n=1 Tax=Eumeta variegata TaxID=151549 RepID=A0A4C1WYG0_EUMVA|nr:hypothetical protein EVAR_32954_1 [Eumeta japonica]